MTKQYLQLLDLPALHMRRMRGKPIALFGTDAPKKRTKVGEETDDLRLLDEHIVLQVRKPETYEEAEAKAARGEGHLQNKKWIGGATRGIQIGSDRLSRLPKVWGRVYLDEDIEIGLRCNGRLSGFPMEPKLLTKEVKVHPKAEGKLGPEALYWAASAGLRKDIAEAGLRILAKCPTGYMREGEDSHIQIVTICYTPIQPMILGQDKKGYVHFGLSCEYMQMIIEGRIDYSGLELYSRKGEFPVETPSTVDFDKLVQFDKWVRNRPDEIFQNFLSESTPEERQQEDTSTVGSLFIPGRN